MIWLGRKRGYLSDWITQRWVQVAGRKVSLEAEPWLAGVAGETRGIGADFFKRLAREQGLELTAMRSHGLIECRTELAASDVDPARISEGVADFYERTASYDMDAWGEWCGVFRPFGKLLALLFSRRLQQLNVPLSALDTSKGVTSDVLKLVDRAGKPRYTAWVRKLIGTNNVLYAGSYSVCTVPKHPQPCIKVVFPLPNGNAMVLMRVTLKDDGSLLLASSGSGFGDTGFYFTVHTGDGHAHVRYLRTFRETIHVYEAAPDVRADHVLRLWGATFLRLHYRLRKRPDSTIPAP